MSDYGSIVSRARSAFASVSRLEKALERAPQDVTLQINLAAKRKFAKRAEEQFRHLAAMEHIEICDYRLLPGSVASYAVADVARSMLGYQNLFSQVHDANRNGKRKKAHIGDEARAESELEFGFSYDGSLGIILLAQSRPTLFDGSLDTSVESMFLALDIAEQGRIRDVSDRWGQAVVTRLHEWSRDNVSGGFSVDIHWQRPSDGRHLGRMVERRSLERIAGAIEATSDTVSVPHHADGLLVGLNVIRGTFHFVVPDGASFQGKLGKDFPRDRLFVINRPYRAQIVESVTEHYATGKVDRDLVLERLDSSGPPAQQSLGPA